MIGAALTCTRSTDSPNGTLIVGGMDIITTVACSLCGGDVHYPATAHLRGPAVCLRCCPPPPPPPQLTQREMWFRLCKRWNVNPDVARISKIVDDLARKLLGRVADRMVDSLKSSAPRRSRPPSVLLYGPTGTGKTTAAFAVLSYLIGAGALEFRDIAIASEAELLVPRADDFGRMNDFRPFLRDKRVLVVEEVCRSQFPASMGDGGEARLALLNYLQSHDIITIFTTNLSMDELPRIVGDLAVVERLLVMVDNAPLRIADSSLRDVTVPGRR